MVTSVLSGHRRAWLLLCDILDVSEEDWQATPERVRRGVTRLWEELQRLREQAGQTSRNSSRAPSSDPPSVPAREKKPTGRAPGGQAGHPGQSRALVPEDEVDEIIPVRPPACDWCGRVFARANCDPHPLRHQVHELPKVTATVKEYQVHTLTCPKCGEQTAGALPLGVPQGMLGPRALATIAACTGHYHLSKRAAVTLLEDICGLQVSEATVCAAERTMSAALEAPVAAAQEAVRQAPDKGIDETGWSQQRDSDPILCAGEEAEASDLPTLSQARAPRGPARSTPNSLSAAPGRLPKAWLWVAVSALATVFRIRRSRGSKVAEEMLGEKPIGSIHTDRWSAYNWLQARRRQLCWAHLLRDFTTISERAGASARLGGDLLAQTQRLFALWRRARDGPLSWSAFQKEMAPIQEAIGVLLREGVALATASGSGPAEKRTAHTCQNLLKWELSLWTFVRIKGVEPTNNRAEQAIRAAVLYRKVSFGTQCSAGSRYVERVMTAVATCKQHQRNVLDYLTAAIGAHYRGESAPSLLPTTTAPS
jgi:transposase